ncbi:MAG: phenylalanine--tRNA ligase subunit beta, partial [Clostridia bacterium]|nr:phenylalanine--tRNA ligase subunit beta [Clostridia bacterium]
LDKPLKMPDLSYETEDYDSIEKVNVEVLDPDLCPRYIAQYVKDIKIEESPEWIKKRLLSMGLRPINNIVDITNFVLLEIGQPMHSFDYQYLTGNKIVVRRATEDEKITTLDDMEFTLNTSNLVICDSEKPQCIAGVMGGKNSCITDETKEIVFESAMFKRDSIRKTSRALGKRSDSSSRFEKGTDAYLAELGMRRALSLIWQLKAGKIAKTFVDVNHEDMQPKVINTTFAKINRPLGIDVPKGEIIKILGKLNFGVDVDGENVKVTIPLYRDDIEDYPDLSEEVIRMYGYDNIIDTLLKDAEITVGGLTKEQKDLNSLKSYLVSEGFSEAITYSFISEKDYDNFKMDKDSDEYRFIRILNPLGEDISIMRTTLLPSMVKVIIHNLNKKNLSGRIFEVAKTYKPKALPLEEIPVQEDKLMLGMFGDGEDFFTIKGVVEGLLKHLRATFNVDFQKCDRPFMHPTRSAEVMFGRTSIGYIGELNPVISEKLGTDKRIYVGEIDYAKISSLLNRKLKYKAIPKFPSVERDLALVMDKTVPNGQVVRCIKKNSDSTLQSIELFDVYEGERILSTKKSMAYHLVFNNPERSLTMEEVDQNVGKILVALKKEGIELR